MDTTDTIEVLLELDDDALANYDSPKVHLEGTAQTGSADNYFINTCTGMTQKFYGAGSMDYDSIIIKTYYGLPYHDWARIKIQFAAIDRWEGDYLVL